MASDQEDLADKLGAISLETDGADTGKTSQDSNTKDGHAQDRSGSSAEVTAQKTNTLRQEAKAPSTTGDNQTPVRKAYIPPHKRTKDGSRTAASDSTSSTHLGLSTCHTCRLYCKISRATNMG